MLQNLHIFFLDHISVSRNSNFYLTCVFLFNYHELLLFIIIIIIIIHLGRVNWNLVGRVA